MKILKKIKKEYFFLILIIILAVVLRLYRISEMVLFDFDQEYAAQFAHDVIKVFPIQMIGQGLSVQGLFMGPFFNYYLVPFFVLFNLHPIGGYIGMIVLRLITILAYFLIFKKIFGLRSALLVTFLNAILFSKIQADWVMASYICEIMVLLTWWGFYKFWQGNNRYLILLGFLFGLYTSFHPVLFPFYFVFIIIFILKHKIPRLRYLFLSGVSFLIPLLPLVVFEYFHKFLELKVLFSMPASKDIETKTLSTLVTYAKIIFEYPLSYLGVSLPLFLKTLIPIIFIIWMTFLILKRKAFWKNKFHLSILSITAVVFLVYYYLLPKHVPQYYFTGVEVIFFIYGVASLDLLAGRKKTLPIFYIILLIIIFSNGLALYQWWNRPYHAALFNKEAVIKEIARREQKREIEIRYNIDVGQEYGLGYLYRYYNIESMATVKGPIYEIVLPKSRTQESFDFVSGDIGLIIRKK